MAMQPTNVNGLRRTRLFPAHGLFDTHHDVARREFQHFGKLEDGAECRLPEAAFQQGDIRSVQLAIEGELLLGQAALGTQFLENLAEGVLEAGGWRHEPIYRRARLMVDGL